MIESLQQLTFWHWLIAALFFFILEMLAPGAIFLWMGCSAFVVSIIVFMLSDLHIFIQICTFVILSVASLLLIKRYEGRHPIISDEPFINRRGDRHIDQIFVLQSPIERGKGEIDIEGTKWKISGDEDMPQDITVKVIAINGNMLHVERVETS